MTSLSQTTEILFNSPALHSLKRDQLVKLCKIHSIKASGKNVELIERLKKVAEELTKGSGSDIATRVNAIDRGDLSVDIETRDNGDEDKENHDARTRANITVTKELPRPSEQWEVMESIAEAENEGSGSRNGTLRSIASHREFGTGGSKSSTMTSIKALASSLGIKRSTSAKSVVATSTSSILSVDAAHNDSQDPSLSERPSVQQDHNPGSRGDRFPRATDDELSKHAIPYSRLPVPSPTQAPMTDHFSDFSHFSVNPPTPGTLSKFDFGNREENAPLPGHVLRPGAPAPDNARLSLGDARFSLGYGLATPRKSTSGPTTTIRLVSSSSMNDPADSPGPSTFVHTFDAEISSTPQLKPWNTAFDLVLGSPHGPGENVKLHPDLPMEDVVVASSTGHTGLHGSTAVNPPSTTAKLEPFVFGSPLPQHRVSNAQFQTAAASVLEEMNRRLLADGVDTVHTSMISNLQPGGGSHLTRGSQKKYADREIKPLRKSFGAHAAKKEVKEKFDKAHQDQFDGMESIAGYVNRKNHLNSAPMTASAGSSSEPVQVGKKRKSNAIDDGQHPPAKRTSTRVISTTRRTVPGGFGDDDDDEEEAPVGKKARVEFSGKEETGMKEANQLGLEKSEKEREAIRKRLEMNRARRRSSAANGRASMGRGRVSMSRNSKPPPKPVASKSRFGFLSSAAKSIVKGVWGGGKKAPATTVAPKPSAVAPVNAPSVPEHVPSINVTEAKAKAASSAAQRKPSGTETGSTKTITPSTSSRSRDISNTGTMSSLGSVAATLHSSRSRSPIPSFAAPTKSSSIRTSTTGSTTTRNGTATSSSMVSRVSGTSATASRVSSLGTRGSLNLTSHHSTSSRLLAPTASSLAKTTSVNKLKSGHLNVPSEKPVASPSSPSFNGAPPVKIFSKPLVVPVGSGLPSPIREGNARTASGGLSVKQRSLSGRKPRISRSKVIAKLASQRAASGSGLSGSTNYTGPSAVGLAAKRSSLGVGVHKAPRKSMGGARRSHVGVSGTRNSEASVLLSAKKRVRQSEYARRRSRLTVAGADKEGATAGASSEAMIVDP
ncbi:hypothetical protein F5880DRAFT_1574902 [Lentinula raphanica]|nr:hypothetical protein F5880DRAFT_1574902 [Lentinula raphanica]